MMTTDELIARAEASLEGVTPGPWEYKKDGGGVRRIFQGNGGNQLATVSVFADWKPIEQKKIAHKRADQNARFFAASRQNVPDLIAALKASEEAKERAEAELEDAYVRGMAAGQAAMPKGTFTVIDSPEIAALRERAELADASAALDRIRQEAEDEALERAAVAAQGQYKQYSAYSPESALYGLDMTPDRSDWGRGIQRGREQAAAAIRALKSGAK